MTTLHGSDEIALEKEICQVMDRVLVIVRTAGFKISLLPINDPNGPPIKFMADQSTAKITFAKNTKNQPKVKSLSNFSSYTKAWNNKPNDFTNTDIPMHARVNCNVEIFAKHTIMKMVAKGIVLSHYQINMRDETDYRGIGLVLPSYQSLGFRNMSFFFLANHHVYVDFKQVARVIGKNEKLRLRFQRMQPLGQGLYWVHDGL